MPCWRKRSSPTLSSIATGLWLKPAKAFNHGACTRKVNSEGTGATT